MREWETHLRALGHQVLQDMDLSPDWGTVIHGLSTQFIDRLDPSAYGPEVDLSRIVKIKRVPGGSKFHSTYLNGTVFSQNIARKSMKRNLSFKSMLLLNINLESFKSDHMEQLPSHERDFANSIANRLFALEPAVIVTTGRVCGRILDIIQSQITVVMHVNYPALLQLADMFHLEIIDAIEELPKVRQEMFQIGQFAVYTYQDGLINNFRKSVVHFNNMDSFGRHTTIILRGGSIEEMTKVKQALKFTLQAALSLQFEYSLFSCSRIIEGSKKVAPIYPRSNANPWQQFLVNTLATAREIIRSTSPFVQYTDPFLLMKLLNSDTTLGGLDLKELTLSGVMPPSFIDSTLTADSNDTFTTPSSEMELSVETRAAILYLQHLRDLSPLTSQVLTFLFSTVRLDTLTPCQYPEEHIIHFYQHNDVALGKYIEDVCFEATSVCPHKGCGERLASHARVYVHGSGKVTVSIEEIRDTNDQTIYVGSACTTCQNESSFEPLSPTAWRYSFGKLLELIFYSQSVRSSHALNCTHDALKERSLFFIWKSYRIRLTYDRIDLFEIFPPRMKIQFNADASKRIKQNEFDSLRQTIGRFFDSITSWARRLSSVISTDAKQSLISEDIADLLRKAKSEQKQLNQSLHEIFVKSGQNDYIAMNVVIHTLLEKYVSWEGSINILLRHLLDRDINYLTAIQLKGLFGERSTPIAKSGMDQFSRPSQSEYCILGTSPGVGKLNLNEITTIMRQPTDSENGLYLTINDFSPSVTPTWCLPKASRLLQNVHEMDCGPKFGSAVILSDEVLVLDEHNETELWGNFSGVISEYEDDILSENEIVSSKSFLMKALANLFPKNLMGPPNIESPILPTEHVFSDSLVVVREDEPSSIIAFTLSSKHYQEKLHVMQSEKSLDELKSSIEPPVSLEQLGIDFEDSMLKATRNHIKYQFWDSQTKIDCKVYFAEQFDALRRNYGIGDTVYINSLSRCFRWEALGGKSGSTFLKTKDDRLIIKQLSKPELDALLKFARSYFTYVSEAFFHKLPTVLAKVFGFYRIGFKNPATSKSLKMDVLVMENLFFDRKISRIFDLKGSMRNRHIQSTGKQNEVLLDENLVEYIYESPLFIHEHSKRNLRASVWNDTLFLSKLNVMDYSLLVGIDEESSELVVGIVDYIRTYTWDKALESWVKETAFLGGGREPTILSPRQYKNRFRESMERYFLSPPTVHKL